MSNSGKGDAFWALIGKLGVIAGLAVAIIGIVTWFNTPTTALRADIETGKFELPPRYSEFGAAVEDAVSPESIEETLERALPEGSKNKKDDWKLLSAVMSRMLAEKAKVFEHKTADPYRGYWMASVVNTGELPVEGVSLRIPSATLAVIDREDGTKLIDTKGPAIEIGTIKAGEKVEVAAWSDSFYYAITSDEMPTIFHSGGSGVVKMKGQVSFLDLVAEYWFLIMMGGILLFVVMLLMAGAIAKQIAASASESTTSSTVVPDQASTSAATPSSSQSTSPTLPQSGE